MQFYSRKQFSNLQLHVDDNEKLNREMKLLREHWESVETVGIDVGMPELIKLASEYDELFNNDLPLVQAETVELSRTNYQWHLVLIELLDAYLVLLKQGVFTPISMPLHFRLINTLIENGFMNPQNNG